LETQQDHSNPVFAVDFEFCIKFCLMTFGLQESELSPRPKNETTVSLSIFSRLIESWNGIWDLKASLKKKTRSTLVGNISAEKHAILKRFAVGFDLQCPKVRV
jgi:hypothetical protein